MSERTLRQLLQIDAINLEEVTDISQGDERLLNRQLISFYFMHVVGALIFKLDLVYSFFYQRFY